MPLFVQLTSNRMVYYFLLHCSILVVINHFFGMGGVKFQLIFAAWGMFWIEQVNYLEHYGLRRVKDKNGIYESIGYMHSWNSASSPMAFRIQRHSDHHAHSYRPYQVLRRFDKAPQLPFEYILMLWLSLVPPLFYMIMDPRVKSIEDAKAGIKNDDQWNNEMPKTASDKRAYNAALVYFASMSAFFTYLVFAF